MKNIHYRQGLIDATPVALGYFPVAFGIGILAAQNGLSAWISAILSAVNLTSAGEVAGINIIGAAGSYAEMILTQILINARYFLMALSLSQHLAPEFTRVHRFIAAHGITDELFALAASRKERVTPSYMYGMMTVAASSWVAGTFLGAFSGELFPARLTQALGILLYGMFIAIIIPPLRESKSSWGVVLISAAISCILYFGFPQISGGFAIIISAIAASVILAIVAPIPEEEEGEEA